MKYKILADRVKLMDSYLISKKKMGWELQSVRNLHPSCGLWQRSEDSLKREWASHNLAYGIELDSETPAYLTGDTVKELAEVICRFGCRNCN